MDKAPRILLLHYVLIAYVTLQFVWWAWLIYDLNVDILELEAQLNNEVASSEAIRSKLWMILGEGSVFFILLGIGAWYIRKFVLREHRLARQERNFLLATTHEFNSPIAAVKLNLQTLQRPVLKEEQKERLVDGALQATTRLQSLVSNVLMASRIDAGKYELLREPVNVDDLMNKLRSSLEPMLRETENELIIESSVTNDLNLDASSLEFILSNLIVNAMKYAPGKPIKITAQKGPKALELTVEDQGPGIPASERENVFRKFYRIGSEETRTRKGTGLGLYLVKELLTMQGGNIRVTSGNNSKGATFELILPYVKT